MSSLALSAMRVAVAPLRGPKAIGSTLRTISLLVLTGVLLAVSYLTLIRDLPVFQVRSVEVVGTDDGLIASTLTGVAREMTTLHVDEGQFDEVAAHFPIVESISADTSFPTGMRLVVEIREPVALVRLDNGVVPVAADGTLLPGVNAGQKVPTIPAEANGGAVVAEAADQVRVIGAAPAPLLELVDSVTTTRETGIAVALEGGVEVRFGTPAAAERKWTAAAAVIADDQLTSFEYIDVSAPDRPAVGGAVGGDPIDVEVEVAPVDPVVPAAEITLETAPVEPVPVP